ncbi:MAG: D-alanyl-lipoteichoic acid biosynthesis protein DltB [Coriobacteriales bacterium]|jgi:membrane protein involved in D-alanine export|nr:D-alanyl-lipoteichoic acid biosynthesis protein DltB [Coriobacteriales bacterium]
MIDFYTSPSFYLLLVATVIPAAILGFSGHRIRRYGLVASLLFIALLFSGRLSELLALLFFLGIASGTTLIVLREWRQTGPGGGRRRLWVYRLSLAAVAAPLVCGKLGGLFDENILGFIGISYLTFKALQVLIEIRDGLIERLNPLDYLYFLLFFAPFTSGPIDRSRRFIQDANRRFARAEYAGLLAKGITLLLLGAVYKLVFSAVASLNYTPETLASGFGPLEVAEAIKDAWAYGLYLFFDFAGYSLMAIGAGCCFGIVTPPNFRAPFAACDIKDFWNRWHMTLSFWLRDFVFMRFTRFALKHQLLGSRQTVACTGYLLNMTLMGVWHGLTFDYLTYGLFHGFLLAATDVYQKRSRFYRRYKDTRPYQIASWALTLNLVMFGFALFSGQAQLILGGLLDGD